MMAKPAATKIRLRNKLHDRPPRPDPPLLRHLPPPPETRRRRSLRPRRRRQLSEDDARDFDHEEEEEEREMKKIRLVVKLPSSPFAHPRRPAVVSSVSSSSSSPSSSPTSSSSSSYVEDESPSENGGEEEETVRPPRKRRIDSCAEVAAPLFSRSGRHEVRKKNAVGRSSGDGRGILPSSWSGAPMPERKELELLLHKLQKNDIYGAFAEPVDPEELPDYHDVIEHPMDFSTVRKKLARGAYRFFEQFEDDVLLICSNAMQYNAPDTVYFRQACVIQDLARKKFQNVRANMITETDQLTEEKAWLNSMEKKTLLTRSTPKTPRKAVAEPLLSDIYSGATVASTSYTCTRLSTVNDVEKSAPVNGLLDASSSRRGSKKEKSVVVNELLDSSSARAIKKEKSVTVNKIMDTSSLVEIKQERTVAVNKIRDTSSSPRERKHEKSAAINRTLDASLSPVGRKQEKPVTVNRFLDASSSPREGKRERSVAINRFLDASSSPGEGKQERSVATNRFLDASSSPGERKQEKSVAVNKFCSTSSSLEESNLENSVGVNRRLDASSSPGESKPDRSVAVSGLLDGSSSLGESKQEKSVAINGLDAASLGERKQEKGDDFSAKSSPSKPGRKPAVDENRRRTYGIIPEQRPTVESNFVLDVLEDEPKQLVPVGLDTEYSYARSLAQFAASLGPFAWEIVSKRIKNSLPPGIKFGPGWVGEYEPLPAPFLSAEKHNQELANSSASFPRTDKKEKVTEMKSKQQSTAAAHKKAPNAVKGTLCDHGGEQKQRPLGVCSTAQPKVNGTFGQKQCSDSSSINSGVNSQTSIQKSFIGTVRVKEESLSEEIAERRQEVVHANNLNHPVPRTISHQPKNQAATFANVSPQSSTSPSSKVRHSSFPELFSRASSHMQTEKDFRAISSQNLNNVPDIVAGGSNNVTSANNSLAFIPSNQTAANYGFNRGNNLGQASNGPFKLATFPGKAGSQQNLSMPIVSQFSKENFSPATSAARSWMSVGTSAQWKPVDGKNSSEKSNISSPFAHPSWRPPSHFNGDSVNLLLQAEAPQVKNRGLVIFPQLIPTDLSKYKNHPHWHSSSPQTPSKKRDNLPPDLNIGYQPPTSPIHPSSNLAMDSQQPDLALQL